MLWDPPEWPVSIYRTWILYFQALSRIELLAKHQGHTNDGFKYCTNSSGNVTCDMTEEMDQLFKLASDQWQWPYLFRQMEKAVALLCRPCTSEPDLYHQFFCISDTAYLVISVHILLVNTTFWAIIYHSHALKWAMHNYASHVNPVHYCDLPCT